MMEPLTWHDYGPIASIVLLGGVFLYALFGAVYRLARYHKKEQTVTTTYTLDDSEIKQACLEYVIRVTLGTVPTGSISLGGQSVTANQVVLQDTNDDEIEVIAHLAITSPKRPN